MKRFASSLSSDELLLCATSMALESSISTRSESTNHYIIELVIS